MVNLFKKLKQILSHTEIQDKNIEANETNEANNQSSVYGKMLNISEDNKRKLVALLTPREHELFLLLLEGFSLKESAMQLSVKYSTANTYITNIYRKLGVNTRAELIINYRYIIGVNNKGP